MKIRAIIFSKDRPMQLECLLRSIREQAPDLFDEIWVQFIGSTEEFDKGYQKLAGEWLPKGIKFASEHGYKRETRYHFKNRFQTIALGLGELTNKGKITDTTHTCLLVDDDIFFNPVSREEVEEALSFGDRKLSSIGILSLRLGRNVKNQIHHDYKSSLDGNIFKNEIIEKVFSSDFKNPNQLEIALIPYCKPYTMIKFDQPKLIGIPANRVSDTSGCSFMEDNTQELLHKFNEGWRIDYKSMDFNCDNVHKYVEYNYFKPE